MRPGLPAEQAGQEQRVGQVEQERPEEQGEQEQRAVQEEQVGLEQ